MITAHQALERLREGNQRFLGEAVEADHWPDTCAERRAELVKGQAPFAVVLGCSDSRVPVELLFDQGLGDLFVIRVAGNVAATSQVGSIEYAVQTFDTPLVVVLGHTQCGAIQATLDEIDRPAKNPSPSLHALVHRLMPSVVEVQNAQPGLSHAALAAAAVRSNVRNSIRSLRRRSELLTRRVDEQQLLVVGAEYSIETGIVEFFYEMPVTGG